MTTTLHTKFAIGDRVWRAWTNTERRQHPCPDCMGSREWRAISPAGGEYTFCCPRCGGGYRSNDEASLDYTAYTPSVSQLTIGSVRIDTNEDKPVTYMCVETGVGSGSIYYEKDLFATKEDAEAAAERLAQSQNATVPWVTKQYSQSLSIADYQLHSAELKTARDLRHRHQARIEMLFYDLRDAETIKEVKDIMDRFSLRDDGLDDELKQAQAASERLS